MAGDDVNGHVLIDIDGGMSCLGSGPADPFASERERPLREVYISSFRMAQHPTTIRQFAAFLRELDSSLLGRWGRLDSSGSPAPLDELADFPVTQISWDTAQLYCRWLSQRSTLKVCLPNEAEWEKAARGGDDRAYPWGDTFSPERCNSIEDGRSGFCSVYELPEGASPYGCMHMAGGVWEWCQDFYHEHSHDTAALVNPVNLLPAARRVVKGGSAFCTHEIVRPAGRDWTNSVNQGGGDDGFRICIRDWR